MSALTWGARLEAAIFALRADPGRGSHLGLIVMSQADTRAWLRELQIAGVYGDAPPVPWPPSEFMGITVFEDPSVDRSFLLGVDGKTYFF